MSSTDNKIVATLRKVEAKVGSLSINNHDEWEEVAARLAAVGDDIPAIYANVRSLIDRCVDALQTVAAKRVDDVLLVIDTLRLALSAAAESLNADPAEDKAIVEAEKVLNDLLGNAVDISGLTAMKRQ